MIIKNLLTKIKFHILYWLLIVCACLTGHFNAVIMFTIIILVHESGHILMGLKYKWHIKKIIILPLGGITIFEDIIDKPLKEELLVAISGIIMQLIFTVIVNIIIPNINPNFNYYSFAIIMFNLIPIYPLDGSKVVNIFLNKLFPFKLSYYITIIISFIFIGLCTLLSDNLTLYLGIAFLFFNLLKEYKNINMVFKKFLLERVTNDFHYPKKRLIYGLKLDKMYRNCYHNFIVNKKRLSETFILVKLFDFTRIL